MLEQNLPHYSFNVSKNITYSNLIPTLLKHMSKIISDGWKFYIILFIP